MKLKTRLVIIYSLVVFFILLSVFFWVTGKTGLAGLSLTLFFICLSIAFREKEVLKGLSFTAIILATVIR